MQHWLSAVEVAIEVTRRCNMFCKHCLRGEQQNKDIKKEYIDTLFSNIGYISNLVFTGGEPSLVPELLEYILDSAGKHRVAVDNFYIATNGKDITDDFVVACIKWYAYCNDNEITAINLSNDSFHEPASNKHYKLLKGLSFFRDKYSNTNTDLKMVIPEGRAKKWGKGRILEREVLEYYIDYSDVSCHINDGLLYLNCNGELIAGCDWSYKNQSKNLICNVNELSTMPFMSFKDIPFKNFTRKEKDYV
jgi:hypothetical protein